MSPGPAAASGGSLKERLAGGRPAMGTFLQLAEPALVEVVATSGFDFAIADLEHGGLDLVQAVGLVRAADVRRFPLLARVPLQRLVQVGQLLDSGFAGILVPQVSTAEQARQAVAAARYPPTGDRGACPGTRSDDFGAWTWDAHVARADASTTVVVAIESAAGAAAAAEICAVDGVDAVFIGVFDLSTSLGVPGQADHPDVTAAVDAIAGVAHAAGLPVGAWSPTVEAARRLLAVGMTFLPVSTDVLLWRDACRQVAGRWRTFLDDPARPAPTSTAMHVQHDTPTHVPTTEG